MAAFSEFLSGRCSFLWLDAGPLHKLLYVRVSFEFRYMLLRDLSVNAQSGNSLCAEECKFT